MALIHEIYGLIAEHIKYRDVTELVIYVLTFSINFRLILSKPMFPLFLQNPEIMSFIQSDHK